MSLPDSPSTVPANPAPATSPASRTAGVEGRHLEIRGTVQGVGFRPWIWRLAHETGVTGRVSNHATGVAIDAFGAPDALDRFTARIGDAPGAASVSHLDSRPIAVEALDGFVIVESRPGEGVRPSIPPDLPTCDDCVAELLDPADRRHRYPFINCTACGPRFTIATAVPYDRATTTMARFPMCPRCRAEYANPADRRFHAEPIACPECGPRLWAVDPSGQPMTSNDPIGLAARALEAGLIVAIKGLGGFHLACDATSAVAVARLRQRKRREEKPFAVMVRDLASAERLAFLGDAERRLLGGAERPVVLAPPRAGHGLAANVAPDARLDAPGADAPRGFVGVMLAYTPIHHLLLAATDRPLVMTSGNLSDEPIAIANDEAVERLGGIADILLLHDRDIANRCDDSVARVVDGAPLVTRRARGWVPRPVPVASGFARPVLACGAQLKNTVCFGTGDLAVLGPHVGDLEDLATFDAYEAAIARLESFLQVRPEVVAHDLHPEYLSTAYARRREGVVHVGVQHHHAHAASLLAEHGERGPILALTWDGTGLGTDGTAWGGELLLADARGFERLATLRPIRLAGADRAIREVWRLALALVEDAFEGDELPVAELPVLAGVPAEELRVVRRMLATDLNAPWAHGAGRMFDAVGALALGRRRAAFEGQVALALEAAAGAPGDDDTPYPYLVDTSRTPWEIDLRPATRAIVYDVRAGVAGGAVAARFHETLAAAGAQAVAHAVATRGVELAGLTGGCFQNARLTASLARRLRALRNGRVRLLLHHQIPAGDGGIALGQAVVADALTRSKS